MDDAVGVVGSGADDEILFREFAARYRSSRSETFSVVDCLDRLERSPGGEKVLVAGGLDGYWMLGIGVCDGDLESAHRFSRTIFTCDC